MTTRRSHRTSRSSKTALRVASTVALVGAATAVAGLGTYGSFTSTTSASEDVAAGKVTIGLTQDATRGLNVAATNLVPGDYAQRAVTLTRADDSETFGSVKLTTAATTTNLLTTDTTQGLQLAIDQCSVAWVKAAGSNDLTCSGTTTAVLAKRAVVGTALDLPVASTALNSAGRAANLRITMSLPQEADNRFQGLGTTVNFVFDATQRAAEAR